MMFQAALSLTAVFLTARSPAERMVGPPEGPVWVQAPAAQVPLSPGAPSRLDRLHTPLNRANRAFNTRDTPPKAAKPSAFFLKFIIAGARPHINTKFENKLDTAIPFSHGIISLFHSERGC